jgi:exoribonuclease R
MEIAATEAERASIRAMQIKYWEKRVGEKWNGMISGVTEWGIFVEDKETRSEGMLPLRNIPDDFYFLEEKQYRIVGKEHGKVFRLGQEIRVTVGEVDTKKKTITLVLD